MPGPMQRVKELLYFDPYTVFGPELFEQLCSKENSLKVVSTEFIAELANWASESDGKVLRKIFPFNVKIVDKDSSTICKQTLEAWKGSNGSKATYQKLHHKLEKYSIFRGRDPIVSY